MCFLFLRVLRCFSSPGAPRIPMCSACGVRPLRRTGFPIRIPRDLRLIAAPSSVSPLIASFIGTLPLGIHQTPFVAC